MSRTAISILAIIIIGTTIITAFLIGNNRTTTPPGKPSSNVTGKLDSPVELTEFVDFQCEACAAYYPIMQQVKDTYKDRVKFRVRYFSRQFNTDHPFSRLSAQNAEAAARQGKFWAMEEKLFLNQKTWESEQNPQLTFDQYAREIGLNMKKFSADRQSKSIDGTIERDLDDIRKLGGDSTPSFTLNGRLLSGNERPSPKLADFKKLLDKALVDAKVTEKRVGK